MELFKIFSLPSTETKGRRVRITPNSPLLKSRTVPFDYACNSSVEVAMKYLQSLGYIVEDTFVGRNDYIIAGGGEWE